MKLDDKFIFIMCEVSSFEIRSEIVNPPETTAFTATEEISGSRKRSPATFTVRLDIRDKSLVFFFSPSAFVHVFFLAARRSSHSSLLLMMMMKMLLLILLLRVLWRETRRDRCWRWKVSLIASRRELVGHV